MADQKQSREDKLLRQAFLELAMEEADTQKASLANDPALLNQAEESYQRHAPHVRWLIRHNTRKKKQSNPLRWLSVAAALLIMLWGGWQMTQLPTEDVVTPLGPDPSLSPSHQVAISPPAKTATPLITAVPPMDSPTPTPTPTPSPTPTATPSPTPLVQAWGGNYFPQGTEGLFETAELSVDDHAYQAVFTDSEGHQVSYTEYKGLFIPPMRDAAKPSYLRLQQGVIAFVTEDASGATLTWDADGQTLRVHAAQGLDAAIRLAEAIQKINSF